MPEFSADAGRAESGCCFFLTTARSDDNVYVIVIKRIFGIIMASMKEIADIAKVSVATVSRVVNKTMRVNDETRVRVERAISDLGYRPNLLATGLRSKSGNIIGLSIPKVLPTVIGYTEEVVRHHNYSLIVGNTHNDPAEEADFIDKLVRRNVDGIIFSQVSDKSTSVDILRKAGIPFVVIDRGRPDCDDATVMTDNYTAGKLAAIHLTSLGHERCVCVTGPPDISLCRERLRGFKDALTERKRNFEDRDAYVGDFTIEAGMEAAKHFLETNDSFTAVWAENDLMAIGFMNALLDRGYRVPDDFSVAGMDDIEASGMVRPRLTTVRQDFKEICRLAVAMLLEMKAGRTLPSRRVIVPVDLLIRESTGRPSTRASLPPGV